MTYFSKLPLTTYEFNSTKSIVKNILVRAAFADQQIYYKDLYDLYTIQDGESPESVSMKFYNSPTYHWIILLFNEIHNPYFDWPIEQITLDYMCKEKYGIDTDGEYTMLKVSHYELDNNIIGEINEFDINFPWTPPTPPKDVFGNIIQLSYPVTFYEYEQGINDQKRVIKIMKPELLADFVRQFEGAMNV